MVKLDVINSALRKIGAKKVNSVDDNNSDLRLALAVYNDMRDDILSRFPWGFATVFATLAEDRVEPVWGYSKAFTLPTDCVMVVAFQSDPNITSYDTEFEVVGSSIYTNSEMAYLRYISNSVDETKWPVYFGEVIAYRIAYEICLQSSKVPNLYEQLLQMFTVTFEQAIYLDKKNSNAADKDEDTNEFLDARV